MSTTTETTAPEEEKLFQVYSSPRQSWKTITKTGRMIIFIEGQFITDNALDIEYLDEEVANGHPWLIKGAPVTSKEADPMARLKAKIIAEYEEEREAQAATAKLVDPTAAKLGETGNTESAKPQPLNSATTDLLASLQANSLSKAK